MPALLGQFKSGGDTSRVGDALQSLGKGESVVGVGGLEAHGAFVGVDRSRGVTRSELEGA